MERKITFVGAGPGDPELITVKGSKALGQADAVFYAGSLVHPAVLKWSRAGTRLVDTAPLDLDTIINGMEKAVSEGLKVVRLHSGDPSLYGAIDEQIARLRALEIEVEVIPGVTAAFAAAAELAMELTMPELSQTVILTRAKGRTPVPESQELATLAAHKATLCIYLSVGQVKEVAEALIPHYGPETPAHVAYRVGWEDQEIFEAPLDQLAGTVAKRGITRQAVIIIRPQGPRAQSRLYHRKFSHGFRKGR